MVNPDAGLLLREVGIEVMGSARRVVVSKDDTIIVDGGGEADAVANRVKHLRAEIDNSDSEWDREKLGSGWPNWPAGWPSSRWAPPPIPSSRSARKPSRTRSRPLRPPSRKASSLAVAPR